MDVGLELHSRQDVRVASDQGPGLSGGERDCVDVHHRYQGTRRVLRVLRLDVHAMAIAASRL